MSNLLKLSIIHLFIFDSFQAAATHDKFKTTPRANRITINVHLDDIEGSDTLFFQYCTTVLNQSYINENFPCKTGYTISKEKGVYHLIVNDIDAPGYFSIGNNRSKEFNDLLPIISMYYLEPGDSITITAKKDESVKFDNPGRLMNYRTNLIYYRISFEGRGATKYQLRYQIDKDWKHPHGYWDTAGNYSDKADKELEWILAQLKNKQGSLSPLAYKVLRLDLISEYNYDKFMIFNMTKDDDNQKINYPVFYKKYLAGIPEQLDDLKTELLSKNYSFFLWEKIIAEYGLKREGNYDNDQFYGYLRGKYANIPVLRDRLLTLFLIRSEPWLNKRDSIFSDAEAVVSSPLYKTVLLKLNGHTTKGSAAYDFSLPDTAGKIIRLSDFKGKVVFIDYWYTGCTACAAYYQGVLSEIEKKYEGDKNVVFITISIDRDRSTWSKSVNSWLYTSPHIVNLYTAGKTMTHPAISHYQITSFPCPMIIDGSGRIFKFNGQELRNGEKLSKAIQDALSS